jgi:hypothetical protein
MPYMYLYYNNALLALPAFEFLLTVYLKIKVTIPKKKITFFFLFSPLFFSIVSLLCHISFIHPIPFSSAQYFSPFFSLPLSLISPHPLHMCSITSLSSLHILYLLSSLSVNTCFFILLVPTSESRHHFSFPGTLPSPCFFVHYSVISSSPCLFPFSTSHPFF